MNPKYWFKQPFVLPIWYTFWFMGFRSIWSPRQETSKEYIHSHEEINREKLSRLIYSRKPVFIRFLFITVYTTNSMVLLLSKMLSRFSHFFFLRIERVKYLKTCLSGSRFNDASFTRTFRFIYCFYTSQMISITKMVSISCLVSDRCIEP